MSEQRIRRFPPPWNVEQIQGGYNVIGGKSVADDLKIAKRGHAGTPQAKTWVSLESGWIVRDSADGGSIEIEYKVH